MTNRSWQANTPNLTTVQTLDHAATIITTDVSQTSRSNRATLTSRYEQTSTIDVTTERTVDSATSILTSNVEDITTFILHTITMNNIDNDFTMFTEKINTSLPINRQTNNHMKLIIQLLPIFIIVLFLILHHL